MPLSDATIRRNLTLTTLTVLLCWHFLLSSLSLECQDFDQFAPPTTYGEVSIHSQVGRPLPLVHDSFATGSVRHIYLGLPPSESKVEGHSRNGQVMSSHHAGMGLRKRNQFAIQEFIC